MVASENRMPALLARVAVVAILGLSALGFIWYGFSAETHQRLWRDIAERQGGPMTFRFVLQPVMALIVALHDGLKDAHTGRSPYFWAVLTGRSERAHLLWEGLTGTARIILLGLAMDAIYQFTVLKTFYPGEMVVIAILLAFIPYLLLRGPIARVARWWSDHHSHGSVS